MEDPLTMVLHCGYKQSGNGREGGDCGLGFNNLNTTFLIYYLFLKIRKGTKKKLKK